MAGPIRIAVQTTADKAGRDIDGLAGKTSGLGGTLGKLGRVAAIGFGATAVGVGLVGRAVVKSASDAEQSLGATETVFGKYASKVIKTSEGAAKAYGLSANEYRTNANLIGSLFKGQGVALDQLGGKTQKTIGTAANLAATFGGTTKDAVEALASAYKGEFDPLERYGISLKQSDINARLAAKGQDKLTGQAAKLAKQVAASELIQKQAAQTNGAFSRETNTLAHQQQVLGAQFDNIKAKAGAALLPVLTSLLKLVNDRLGPAFEAVGRFVAPLIARFSALFSSASGGSSRLAPLVAALGQLGAFVTGTVLPVIASLVNYFAAKLGPIIAAVANIIATRLVPIAVSMASFFVGTVVPAVVAIATKVGTSLKPILDQLFATIQTRILPAVAAAAAKFQQWMPTIQRVAVVVLKVVGTVLQLAAAILGKVLPVVIRFAGFLIGTVVAAVLKVIGVLVRIVAGFLNVGRAVVDGVRKFADFANKVDAAVRRALGFVGSIPGKVRGALSGAGDLLVNAGKAIIGGLIRGIDSMIDSALGKLRKLTSLIPKVKGPESKDRTLLYGAGRLIIGSLVRGFDAETPYVAKALEALTRDIETFGATPQAAIKLSATDALHQVAAAADLRHEFSVRLTAEQVSQLQRGRAVKADLAAINSKGRRG